MMENENIGIDITAVLINQLNKELNIEYISNVSQRYPDIFEQRGEELFFSDDLKFIYPGALEINITSFNYNISPLDDSQEFIFKMLLFLPRRGVAMQEGHGSLFISWEIKLSDEVCMLFYNNDVLIEGYDREVIIRRWTINNIIN